MINDHGSSCPCLTFLTSTCALSHLSILKDLTLEMWVPSLRCSAAQRMHRKMPNCHQTSVFASRREYAGSQRDAGPRDATRRDTYAPACPSYVARSVDADVHACAPVLTWVLRATVGTGAVSRDRLDQILQRTLVARLLTLVQGGRHVLRKEERRLAQSTRSGSGRRRTRATRGGMGRQLVEAGERL